MHQITLEWTEAGQHRSIELLNTPSNRQPNVIRIGRDPTQCDLVLTDGSVSALHVEISFDAVNRRASLQNLRPSNPPLVDNVQAMAAPILLREGSQIQLGQVKLLVKRIQFEVAVGSVPTVAPLFSGKPTPPGETQSAFPAIDSGIRMSQLIPIVSTGRDLRQKAFLVPGIFTVVLVVSLFAAVGSPGAFNLLIALYIGVGAMYFVYRLCGKSKPWWTLVASGFVTVLLLVIPPFFALFALVFRRILPGQLPTESAGLIQTFISMFFGAGLLEELFKSMPVFGAMWLSQRLKSPWRERIGVAEPLDGILLATASALGFTWLETLGQYVPDIVANVTAQADAGSGELLGLQLLIPRILGSVAGHMAYSGYFGYFIGLSVLKPSARWQILGIGYLSSALLHALWNTVGGGILGSVVGVASYAFLAAAILKARELSPTRANNFATGISLPPRR